MTELLKRCWPVPATLFALLLVSAPARADDWPQWLGPQRDGVWRETRLLDKFPKGGPTVVWRTKIGPGYTGPAVAGGRVYVMDRQGDPLKKGQESSGRDGLKGQERVLCLDAASGKEIWTHSYDCTYKISYPSGPRTTPVVAGGRVYTLGSMGDVRCLDADKGTLIWAKNLLEMYHTKPPLWGFAAHLLLDGDRLITLAGGKESVVVALNKDTGNEVWRALSIQGEFQGSSEVGYAPPVIYEAGGKRQLIVWHPEALNSLDPVTGKVYWTIPFPANGKPVRPGITVGMPRKEGDLLVVSSIHHGCLAVKLAADKPEASIVWQGKSANVSKPDGLHSMTSTVLLKDGYLYGVCAFGELRCLKAATGERVWDTFQPTTGEKAIFGTAFLVQQGDRCFIFNDQGDLVLCRLKPTGYEEISRAHLLKPTLFSRGRDVVWSHPAFANRCVYVRNDEEIICVSLAARG